MSCKMCGKCCEAIYMGVSPDRIKEMVGYKPTLGAYRNWKDAKFVSEHFIPITKEEAFGRNPLLETWGVKEYFYRCDMYSNGKCTVHNTRPEVCYGYPFYESGPRRMKQYNMSCGYIPSQWTLFKIEKAKLLRNKMRNMVFWFQCKFGKDPCKEVKNEIIV